MPDKTREQKRCDIFNGIVVELQLFGIYNTYQTFLGEFGRRMELETGECTEADKVWGEEHLDWFVKRNSQPEKKDRRRRENRES